MRMLAFGDADSRVWGVAWRGLVCVGAGETSQRRAARLEGAEETADWRLLGEGVELTASPVADAVVQAEGFDQLCRIHGSFELEGAVHTVHSLGRRGARADGRLDSSESVRDVCAWFEPDAGLALVAARPQGADGQEADLLVAAVLDLDGAAAVADPRLSTTYGAAGRPARAGLELWLSDGENEFPVRAAGEALGASVAASEDDLEVRAELFRWHSRGREGAGVYLLAQRR